MNAALRRAAIAARACASAAALVVAVSTVPANVVSSRRAPDIDPRTQSYALLDTAWEELARGDAVEARRLFGSQRPVWRNRRSDGSGYIDVERGYFLATLFAGDDVAAGKLLTEIAPPAYRDAATKLALDGRLRDACLAYYDASADALNRDVKSGVLRDAARGIGAGKIREAIRILSRPADGEGPFNLGDVDRTLVGDAHATLGDWPAAVETWVAASRMGRAVPEWQPLWPGNLAALTMLYDYRDRYPRGEHAYRFRLLPLSAGVAPEHEHRAIRFKKAA